VTGVDDQVADGDQEFMIILTVDIGLTVDSTGYRLIEPASVTMINEDNDVAGGNISKDGTSPSDDSNASSATEVGGCFIGSLSLF